MVRGYPYRNSYIRQLLRFHRNRTFRQVSGMAAPEWFDERGGVGPSAFPAGSVAASAAGNPVGSPVAVAAAGGGAAGVAAQAGEAPVAGADAPESDPRAAGLVQMGMETLRRCGDFFDPVVLANLDAALAHELAHRAGNRAANAEQALEGAIRESRTSEALAHLAQQASSSKATATKAGLRAAEATAVVTSLGGMATNLTGLGFDQETVDGVVGGSLVDAIAVMEEAKNALSAAQAQAQALFVARQRLDQARSGVPQERLGRGIVQQVALARHESPHRGRQLAELAEVLVREMPHTMNALVLGKINEYRATIVARETAFLSFEDRAKVDELICGDPDAAALLGTRELAAASRKAAYELDPQAFIKRHEKAVGDRYVSLRPAPDGMTFLTALIPLKQGIRILATLTRVADSAKARGDERSKGQVMADALMHRLIQHAPCDEGAGTLSDHRGVPADGTPAGSPSGAHDAASGSGHTTDTSWAFGAQHFGSGSEPRCTTVNEADIALELIMTDRSLFGGANDPAVLVGYEPIPAPLARNMILGDGDGDGDGALPRVWLKRLFTHPENNALMAMDSRSRLFPEGMKEFIRCQDQRCQTPYCDAPIRQYDHIKAYAAGGPTSIENGQGLCADCNLQKEAPGWSFERGSGRDGGLPTTEIRTPTGHRYVSTAPPLPGGSG